MFRPVPACGDSGRIVGRVDGICTSQFAAARSSTGRANQKAQNPFKLSDSAEPQSPVSSSFTYYPLRGSQTPLSEAIVREFSFEGWPASHITKPLSPHHPFRKERGCDSRNSHDQEHSLVQGN